LYSQHEPADGPNPRRHTEVPRNEPHSPLAPHVCQGVNIIEAITVESLVQPWSASMPNRLQGMHWAMCARACFAQNGLSSSLTGVGVGVGKGVVGESEMAQVRRAVCDARAERLQIDKLSSIKPYSRHGH